MKKLIFVRDVAFSIIFVLCINILFCTNRSELQTSMNTFPADGVSGGSVLFIPHNGSSLILPSLNDSISIISRESDSSGERIRFVSGIVPGTVTIRTTDGVELHLTFYKIPDDIDGDGFPECAELVSESDRSAFRGWFVRIAESQFLKRSALWRKEDRDCAGLVRFSYKEALKKHDEQWLKRSGMVLDKNIPDVEAFSYPNIPVLGSSVFKVCSGSSNQLNSFGDFADAGIIAKLNCRFLSKKISDAKEGDLLFFIIDDRKSPWHSMIVAGTENGERMLIYHTGVGDVIKRVPVSYLDKSDLFNVSESNTHFLGVFRFNILE